MKYVNCRCVILVMNKRILIDWLINVCFYFNINLICYNIRMVNITVISGLSRINCKTCWHQSTLLTSWRKYLPGRRSFPQPTRSSRSGSRCRGPGPTWKASSLDQRTFENNFQRIPKDSTALTQILRYLWLISHDYALCLMILDYVSCLWLMSCDYGLCLMIMAYVSGVWTMSHGYGLDPMIMAYVSWWWIMSRDDRLCLMRIHYGSDILCVMFVAWVMMITYV